MDTLLTHSNTWPLFSAAERNSHSVELLSYFLTLSYRNYFLGLQLHVLLLLHAHPQATSPRTFTSSVPILTSLCPGLRFAFVASSIPKVLKFNFKYL